MSTTAELSSLSEEELESLRAGTLGLEAEVGEIPTKLHQLWDDDESRSRASLVNFVIYSEQMGSLIKNSALLSEVTKEHACRALLVMALPGEAAKARAWITAHCHLANGRKTVCSEQISFLLQGRSSATIRNIVFSHLDSDLPLVFWWQGDFSDKFEDRLYSVIDRLLIDSETWTEPGTCFGTLAAAGAEASSRFVVSDLTWARTHALRTGFASIFENPTTRRHLDKIEELHLRQDPEHPLQTAFLLAWFGHALEAKPRASREGWDLVRDDGSKIRVIREDCCEKGLRSIELRAPGCSFLVRESGERLESVAQMPETTARQLLPEGPPDGPELIKSLLGRSSDRSLYLSLLPVVRELI